MKRESDICMEPPVERRYRWKSRDNGLNEVAWLPIDLEALQDARISIREACRDFGVESTSAFEIELLVEELLTNALYATHKRSEDESVLLRWKFQMPYFIVFIMDYGGGIPKSALSTEVSDTEPLIPRKASLPKGGTMQFFTQAGRGLAIIRGISEKVDVVYHYPDGSVSCEKSGDTKGSIIIAKYLVKHCP